MRQPYAIIGPRGLAYIGLHETEEACWHTYLGWPTPEEIADAKARGFYCALAEVKWTAPAAADPS